MPETIRYIEMTSTKATATSPQMRNSARMKFSRASFARCFESMRSAACSCAAAGLFFGMRSLVLSFTLPLPPFGVMTWFKAVYLFLFQGWI